MDIIYLLFKRSKEKKMWNNRPLLILKYAHEVMIVYVLIYVCDVYVALFSSVVLC